MKAIMAAFKPQLNQIGEALQNMQESFGITAPSDLRVVIVAVKAPDNKVHTMMQFVESTPHPTDGDKRIDRLLVDTASGKPMMMGIEGLVQMLGQSQD